METERSEFNIDGVNGRRIYADVTLPVTDQRVPLIIFFHGFKGFKDWGAFNLMARRLAIRGIATVKFNAAFNGINGGAGDDMTDLTGFSKNTFRFELNDIKCIIDACLHNNMFSDRIDSGSIILMGHSRGGGIAIITASRDSRITKIITLASVARLERLIEKYNPEEWKRKGKVFIPNSRTGIDMPMDFAILEDYLENRDEYNVTEAAKKLTVPHLIVHAEDDDAVPVADAEELSSNSKLSEKFIIKSGGHTFGSFHPWEKDHLPEELESIIERINQFIFNIE